MIAPAEVPAMRRNVYPALLQDADGADQADRPSRRRPRARGRLLRALFHPGGVCQAGLVLLDGINHVAVITADTDRLVEFYGEVFGATVDGQMQDGEGLRLTLVKVGPHSELNVFEVAGNDEASRQVPMFGRGRLDHLGFQAADIDAFDTIRDRLMARGATDGFVTDFGHVLSVFFTDPDGLEAEVCVTNPDARAGRAQPSRYAVEALPTRGLRASAHGAGRRGWRSSSWSRAARAMTRAPSRRPSSRCRW